MRILIGLLTVLLCHGTGGMRFVLEQIATRDPTAENVNPESFMEVRFVKQLEDSGFVQTLYPKG
jgi:hypothetical protein